MSSAMMMDRSMAIALDGHVKSDADDGPDAGMSAMMPGMCMVPRCTMKVEKWPEA